MKRNGDSKNLTNTVTERLVKEGRFEEKERNGKNLSIKNLQNNDLLHLLNEKGHSKKEIWKNPNFSLLTTSVKRIRSEKQGKFYQKTQKEKSIRLETL